MIKPKHLIAIMVAVTIVAVILLTGYISLFVKSMTEDSSITNLTRLLRDWQSQSGAGFAVLAAILAGTAVLYQTAVSANIEERKKKRRFDALSSIAPMELASVIDWIQSCVQACEVAIVHVKDETPDSEFEKPKLPTRIIDVLLELMSNMDGPAAHSFKILLSQIQVMDSRMIGVEKWVSTHTGAILTEFNLTSHIVNFSEIYARCESLIYYCRNSHAENRFAISSEDAKRALFLLSIDPLLEEKLDQEIERRRKIGWYGTVWPEVTVYFQKEN